MPLPSTWRHDLRNARSGADVTGRAMPMDVRSIVDREPEVEHNGTVPVWYLVHPREMKELTDGGFVELINEFEVAAGGAVFPHSHPTHEWYFVMSGRGVMTSTRRNARWGPATSSTSRPSRCTACAPS